MIEILFAYLPANIFTFFLLGSIGILGIVFLLQIKKTQWVLYFLLVWFPLESLILRYTHVDYYAYVKYLPEVMLYGLAVGAWIYYMVHNKKFLPKNPLTKWFVAYILIACVSLLLNQYSPFIWAFGLRQILRFALVFFIVLFCGYNKKTLFQFIWIGGAMILLQAVLGIIQFLAGGHLDKYLFSAVVVTIGNSALLGGGEQFWAPGSRVFATMGRYNTLASFLALGTAFFFPLMYVLKEKTHQFWFAMSMGILAITSVLTFSRAGWIAMFFAIIAVGIIHLRDKRVVWAVATLVIAVIGYVGIFSLAHENISRIVDQPKQSLAERLLEAVSIRSFTGSYEGYGRIFFIVNTPRMVVSSAPFFGVGPGNYGGGVAAALVNTKAYDRLKMPFGIQNTYGQIDNNWLSIWGEVGTLGLFVWIGLFVTIFKGALFVAKKSRDIFEVTLARGVLGAVVAVCTLSFFAPYFEFRALMFYFWLAVGMVFLIWQKEKSSGNLLEK
jgi:hypothetical protein